MASDSTANLGDENHSKDSGFQRTYQVVVAASRNLGLGINKKMAWDLPLDTKFFTDITKATTDPTKRNAVIMGRKTWESTPSQHRPLARRLNVVLTRSGIHDIMVSENVLICRTLKSALELLAESHYSQSIETVFLIGGGVMLKDCMNASGCDAIHLTEIDADIECDTFIPAVDTSVFQPWYSSFPSVENNLRYSFVTYVRVRKFDADSLDQCNGLNHNGGSGVEDVMVNRFSFLPKMILERHEEYVYMRLVEDIISNGISKDDSTGNGTLSKFGCQMRFNLRKSFPLLTTKKVLWRGIVEELLWYISGSTNAKVVQEKDIHIWNSNGFREDLDSIALLDMEEGDLGPVYGFQWRPFGARDVDKNADYSGQGFDQLSDVISKIKNNPHDRRIILSAWNPNDRNLTSLVPCHMFAQFYVANGELSCQMYQHSADMGLEVPSSIASYALLTCVISHVCDLIPGDFIHVIGDAHVYPTHLRPLHAQLQKQPRPFPILKINPLKKDIDSLVAADFVLVGYDPHEKSEMKTRV